jgi:hypothetical protein
MAETTTDRDLAAWLAEHTATDVAEVERELELGARRRAFVVDELVDAGLTGVTLLDGVIRCTGLELDDALRLIAERASDSVGIA